MRVQQFDGRLGAQIDLLPQIDLGKAALAQQTRQTIVPKLLTFALSHRSPPPRAI